METRTKKKKSKKKMNLKNNILKRVYFIRHGKTPANEKGIYQDASIALSSVGEEQAKAVAERFKSIPAETIVSSDYRRAEQTAEAISLQTEISIVFSELFREVKRPSDIIGKEKKDSYAQKIFNEMIENELDANWHHLDEENLFDLTERAKNALSHLTSLPEKNIIVVTHEFFLKTMLSVIATTDAKNAVSMLRHIRYFMIGSNTGITIAEYGNFGFGKKWRLVVWNDLAHL